jgi:protein TonB
VPAPRSEATSEVEVAAARSAAGRPGSGRSLPGAATDTPAPSRAPAEDTTALASSGDGPGAFPAEYGPYLARFRRRVQEALVYPLSARRRGLVGTVELEVLIEPAGEVRSARVIVSSSHAVLDEAGLDAVRSLPPLPLPEGLARRPLRVRLPLSFELR